MVPTWYYCSSISRAYRVHRPLSVINGSVYDTESYRTCFLLGDIFLLQHTISKHNRIHGTHRAINVLKTKLLQNATTSENPTGDVADLLECLCSLFGDLVQVLLWMALQTFFMKQFGQVQNTVL